MRIKMYKSPFGMERVLAELKECENRYGKNHLKIVPALNSVGDFWLEHHVYNPSKSEVYYRKALAIRELKLGNCHPDIADSLYRLGRALMFQNRLEDALPLIKNGVTICKSNFDDSHWRVGRSVAQISQILFLMGHRAEALQYYAEAERIWLVDYMARSETFPDFHPDYDLLCMSFEIREKSEILDQIQHDLVLDKPLRNNGRRECFIATAVYGSEDAPEVQRLRLFRDCFLGNFWIGVCIISIYYRISPLAARCLKRSDWGCVLVRHFLNMIIRIIDIFD